MLFGFMLSRKDIKSLMRGSGKAVPVACLEIINKFIKYLFFLLFFICILPQAYGRKHFYLFIYAENCFVNFIRWFECRLNMHLNIIFLLMCIYKVKKKI